MQKIPTSLKTLIVKNFRSRDFEIVERAVPKLDTGEVLVKVHGAPINPLDLLRIDGQVPNLKVPFVPGSECSGTIIDANHHHKDQVLGKKVSTHASGGAWANYVVAKVNTLIVHDNPVDMNQAACGWVNPLTAYIMFFNATRLLQSAGIAVTAGNSNHGKTLLRICNKAKTPLISIIRSQSKAAELKELGQQDDRILVSEDKQFPQKYAEVMKKYKVKVIYDCVSGSFAGSLINGLPRGGKYINFGSMSGQPIGEIDPTNLRFQDLSVQGFAVFNFMPRMNEDDQRSCLDYVRDNFDEIGHTKILGTIPFERESILEHVEKYKSDMGRGKYVIKMPD